MYNLENTLVNESKMNQLTKLTKQLTRLTNCRIYELNDCVKLEPTQSYCYSIVYTYKLLRPRKKLSEY